jgi:hypothetical protein
MSSRATTAEHAADLADVLDDTPKVRRAPATRCDGNSCAAALTILRDGAFCSRCVLHCTDVECDAHAAGRAAIEALVAARLQLIASPAAALDKEPPERDERENFGDDDDGREKAPPADAAPRPLRRPFGDRTNEPRRDADSDGGETTSTRHRAPFLTDRLRDPKTPAGNYYQPPAPEARGQAFALPRADTPAERLRVDIDRLFTDECDAHKAVVAYRAAVQRLSFGDEANIICSTVDRSPLTPVTLKTTFHLRSAAGAGGVVGSAAGRALLMELSHALQGVIISRNARRREAKSYELVLASTTGTSPTPAFVHAWSNAYIFGMGHPEREISDAYLSGPENPLWWAAAWVHIPTDVRTTHFLLLLRMREQTLLLENRRLYSPTAEWERAASRRKANEASARQADAMAKSLASLARRPAGGGGDHATKKAKGNGGGGGGGDRKKGDHKRHDADGHGGGHGGDTTASSGTLAVSDSTGGRNGGRGGRGGGGRSGGGRGRKTE